MEGTRWRNLPVITKGHKNRVESPEECQKRCIGEPQCQTWEFNGTPKKNKQGVIAPNGGCTLTNIEHRGSRGHRVLVYTLLQACPKSGQMPPLIKF